MQILVIALPLDVRANTHPNPSVEDALLLWTIKNTLPPTVNHFAKTSVGIPFILN